MNGLPNGRPPHVLLVEDEPGLVLTLTDRLTAEGYTLESVRDGDEALDRATQGGFDLILLDIMLPGRDGFDVCRALRRHGIETPVLMLTARGEVVDRVVGLKLGADDYLTKPFETAELLARMEALLRRARPLPGVTSVYRSGDLLVDLRRAEVRRQGQVVDLSARELKLLQYFIEHRGETLSRNELLNEVWGYNSMPSTRTVDVHVAWLRQKLEDSPKQPKYIHTVHGLGYKFVG